MATILVIEDNRANLKLASLLLTRAGHEVLSATDAETGLMLASSGQPALVLMDIQLPGMDGLTATSLLKKDPRTAGIPVIALTAMAMKEDQDRSREAGCDAYITKPLRYRELYDAVDALLAGQPYVAQTRYDTAGEGGTVAATGDGGSPFAAGPGTAPVQVRVLEMLVGADPATVADFLAEYRSGAQSIGTALLVACDARDAHQISRQAHTLKSSSRAVGATTLADLCEGLEAAGRAGDLESTARLRAPFERELVAVIAFLDSRRERDRD